FGLILHDGPTVVSNSGLVVDPAVAQKQIDDETSSANQGTKIGGTTDDGIDGGTRSAGTGSNAEGATTDGGAAGGGDMQVEATRFHAIKALDPTRPVRDISQISDEILTLFTASGAPVKITVDIESTSVAKLTPDQVTALKENLNTLGFNEWNLE